MGDVYVIYTIRQMANDLNRNERTVKAALAELENAGLITRVRQGWNRANRIFLQLPDEVQLSSRPAGSTTPTITPQSASGWTRTANRSPEKITTIQRPMRKENACECESNHGCNR